MPRSHGTADHEPASRKRMAFFSVFSLDQVPCSPLLGCLCARRQCSRPQLLLDNFKRVRPLRIHSSSAYSLPLPQPSLTRGAKDTSGDPFQLDSSRTHRLALGVAELRHRRSRQPQQRPDLHRRGLALPPRTPHVDGQRRIRRVHKGGRAGRHGCRTRKAARGRACLHGRLWARRGRVDDSGLCVCVCVYGGEELVCGGEEDNERRERRGCEWGSAPKRRF